MADVDTVVKKKRTFKKFMFKGRNWHETQCTAVERIQRPRTFLFSILIKFHYHWIYKSAVVESAAAVRTADCTHSTVGDLKKTAEVKFSLILISMRVGNSTSVCVGFAVLP